MPDTKFDSTLETEILSLKSDIKVQTFQSNEKLILHQKSDPTGERVSCLMVTRAQLAVCRYSIECFRNQTYSDLELIIVTDRKDHQFESYLTEISDPRIKYILINSSGIRLGNLRNIAIGCSTGQYVTQWDDDDLSDPIRVQVCMGALKASRSDAVFLESWTMISPSRKAIALSGRRLWEGSFIAKREILPVYHNISKAEDTRFVAMLALKSKISVLSYPNLYLYFETGKNTWDKRHFDGLFASSARVWEGNDYNLAIEWLNKRMPVIPYIESIQRLAEA